MHGLSKIADNLDVQSGSAAPLYGKPSAFRHIPAFSSSSAQAGRLSLPACAEEVLKVVLLSERRSLSAMQAAKPLWKGSTVIWKGPGLALPSTIGKHWRSCLWPRRRIVSASTGKSACVTRAT